MATLRAMSALTLRRGRLVVAGVLSLVLATGVVFVHRGFDQNSHIMVVGYFDNSNGLFVGDDVRIRGVHVGEVAKIEPQPLHVKISFWWDRRFKVPADAKAVILSPQLVTGRAIQLIPAYNGGPVMHSGAVIPEDRTAVPVEWDDLRVQLERITDVLKPTQPGGPSTLGAFINTAAENLRGQGANIRDSIVKLSQAISILGDHSKDIFGTLKNMSTVVDALHGSTDVLEELNRNMVAVTSLLANDPNKIGRAVEDLNAALADVRSFAAENRQALGTTSDKLASITTVLVDSLDDIKQTLHIAPTTFANFNNIYEPANGAMTGALAINNFADPIQFLCGAIQAASRLGAEQSAKLCVQYLAPIIKNRQYNYLPIGENAVVGPTARPNEVTYTEDWMRPDFVPPNSEAPSTPSAAPKPSAPNQSLPAAPVAVDPSAGLPGMMSPPAEGSS